MTANGTICSQNPLQILPQLAADVQKASNGLMISAGDAPVTADHNLLAASKLELGPPQRLLRLRGVHVLAANGQQDLPNGYARAGALRLSKGAAHSSLRQAETVSLKFHLT